MKITIGVGASIIILLCGCVQHEQIHSTSLPAPASSTKLNLNVIDELPNRIDNGVRKKLYSIQFFGGFLANPEQSQLDWQKFKSEQQRSEATGYPDTYMSVWSKQNKILYVTSERGMTSGVGWWEHCAYYFRPDETLAKLIFTYSSGVGMDNGELIRYYNSKGKVIHSSTNTKGKASKGKASKGKSPKPQPTVYLRTKSLPAYRLLRRLHAQ